MVDEAVITRFWAKVRRSSGCWEWTASCAAKGYGQLVLKLSDGSQKRWLAHRLSWVLHFGEIPLGPGYHGTCVLHRCDNPKCVKPAHLFLGTNADNVHDMMVKGRMSLKRATGEAHGSAKLNAQQVLSIRNDERSRTVIAKEYCVHPNTISNVRRGLKWKSVAA